MSPRFSSSLDHGACPGAWSGIRRGDGFIAFCRSLKQRVVVQLALNSRFDQRLECNGSVSDDGDFLDHACPYFTFVPLILDVHTTRFCVPSRGNDYLKRSHGSTMLQSVLIFADKTHECYIHVTVILVAKIGDY
jgi:hypothetical protein